MHKLVFEEDVLPDGTELAYFARGKVIAYIDKWDISFILCLRFLHVHTIELSSCLIIQLLRWLPETVGWL